MREIWLHNNRRAILLGCIPPFIVAAIGLCLLFGPESSLASVQRGAGLILLLLGLGVLGFLLLQLGRPRVAFERGQVQFYLRGGAPIGVPVEIVEAFFAGQGPAHLPVVSNQSQTVNLVARLSQRHTEWAEQKVKTSLGKWAEGYVTIRGSWCEPLNSETIRRLNRRLKEVKDNPEPPSPS